jgi:hypothetical protein
MHHCTLQVFIVVCQTLNYYLEFLYIFSLIHFLKYLFFSLFFFSENHLSLSIIFIYDPKHYIFLLDYIWIIFSTNHWLQLSNFQISRQNAHYLHYIFIQALVSIFLCLITYLNTQLTFYLPMEVLIHFAIFFLLLFKESFSFL